jgi:diguanylate cyclase (GGDEF)-like protein/PAS domain S-box-containing protein
MKLFWKIFTAVFISFVMVISFISYVIIVRQISDAENRIAEENRVMGSFISKEVEKSYRESRWPFESLKELSERHGFLFWWVVRDDGTIHLADDVSFMGTYAFEYFPPMVSMRDRNLFLNRSQNYGIVVEPLKVAENEWSFWLGFSLREFLEIRKEIILRVMIVSLLALGMLGVTLYFLTRHFTKPIKDLTVGAATVGRGDLTHRVKIESEDELGQLANSFNKMAENLQKATISKDYMDNIVNNMIDTLTVVDQDAKISTMNKATCKLLGYKEEELIGRPVETLFAVGEEIPLSGVKLEKLIEEGEVSNYETYYKTKEGKKIPVLFSCSVMKNEDGGIICIVCTARDITSRRRQEEQLAYMATHDPLTGLPNWALFNDRLTLALARAQRNQQKLAVMLLDLDQFKEVNDTLGHKIGDKLLQAVGDRLKKLLRKSDTIARMGGDEFLLLLAEIARTEDATKVAQKILEAVRQAFVFNDHKLSITSSIGVAIYPTDGDDVDTLVKCADIAMYQAKAKGRNHYQCYSSKHKPRCFQVDS